MSKLHNETSIPSESERMMFSVITFTGNKPSVGIIKRNCDIPNSSVIGDVLIQASDLDAIIAALQAAREALK